MSEPTSTAIAVTRQHALHHITNADLQ